MLYTLTDIEAQIAPQTFAHGLQWFTDGRVTRPNIQGAGEIVTAIIPQVGDRALRVYVRTFKDGDALTIHGECSCATKGNCEHVVAVLLQALQDGEALPETLSRAPSAQIQGNDSALDPARPNATTPSQVLLYLLRLDEAGLVVEPHVARRLKHGGYSLGRSFQLGGGRRRTPPRFLQAIDLELLIALDRLPRSYRDTPVLQGAESDPVLRSLLASGRLQLADDDDLLTPLRLGAARPIRLEWRCDEAAVQEIMGHTDPGCDLLLLIGTTRPTTWYLDETTGECGPVDSTLPGATADELLRLPPIAPEQTGEIRDTLARTYPNAEIPLPQLFAIETLPCSQPLPCLRLTTEEEDWDGFKEYTDFAHLRFDYGGVEVDPTGPDTRMRDGCVVRVRRNRKAERAAVQQLQKLGLVCNDVVDLTGNETHFVPDSDFGFSDAEAWLDFQADQLPTLRDLGWRISYQNFRFR
ncbi:MAG: SWIM zinc finger family protein, partial [Sedimenticolaceae bacterium]